MKIRGNTVRNKENMKGPLVELGWRSKGRENKIINVDKIKSNMRQYKH